MDVSKGKSTDLERGKDLSGLTSVWVLSMVKWGGGVEDSGTKVVEISGCVDLST